MFIVRFTSRLTHQNVAVYIRNWWPCSHRNQWNTLSVRSIEPGELLTRPGVGICCRWAPLALPAGLNRCKVQFLKCSIILVLCPASLQEAELFPKLHIPLHSPVWLSWLPFGVSNGTKRWCWGPELEPDSPRLTVRVWACCLHLDT